MGDDILSSSTGIDIGIILIILIIFIFLVGAFFYKKYLDLTTTVTSLQEENKNKEKQLSDANKSIRKLKENMDYVYQLTEEVDCVKDMISTNDNLLQNKEKKSHKRKLFKKDDEDLHKDLGF